MRTMPHTSRRSSRRSVAAFSLVENLLACSIVALGLAGTFTVNGQTMPVFRMAKDEACASQVLQQRVENLRIANWQRISDPTWIRDHLLNVSADGSGTLNGLTETITVSPYNGAGAANTFTRTASGAVAGSNNASL